MCILSKFTKKNPASSPDLSKLHTLFQCCRERDDDTGKTLLAHESEILCAKVEIRYHINCRSTYCSPAQIKRLLEKRSRTPSPVVVAGSSGGRGALASGGGSSFTRSKAQSGFDWKQNCFFCGYVCHAKLQNTSGRSWSVIESAIDKHGDNIYNKVLAAAK